MRHLASLCMLLFLASSSWAQIHLCDSCSVGCPSKCHSTRLGGSGADSGDPQPPSPPPCNTTNDPCLKTQFDWQTGASSSQGPQYRPEYLYRLFTENKPGGPLPWADDGSIQAQAVIDRWQVYKATVDRWEAQKAPYDRAAADPELIKEWAERLVKTIRVYYTWESPELARESIQELNKEVIKEVRNILTAQILKLQPFPSDPPEVRALKMEIAHKRLDFLDSRWNESGVAEMPAAHSPKLTRHELAEYWVNPPLGELIRISEKGSWENLQCGGEFCY